MRTVSVLTGLVLPLALSAQEPAGWGDWCHGWTWPAAIRPPGERGSRAGTSTSTPRGRTPPS
jgi:hypothetical protein